MSRSVKRLEQYLMHALFGLVMGVMLSFIGFADYAEVHRMFIFADLRLLFVFAGAVGLCMIGFMVLARGADIPGKSYNRGTIPGAALFGLGWALTGACPSIALVQLGGGQLAAMFTVVGMFCGVWAYRRIASGSLQLDTGVCGEA